MDIVACQEKGSPTLSPQSAVSPALIFAGDTTVVPQYTPTEYERTTFYNGITEDGDHPVLIYRSNFGTTLFPKPVGKYAHIPVKSVRGVYGTSGSTSEAAHDVSHDILTLLEEYGVNDVVIERREAVLQGISLQNTVVTA